VSSLSHLVGALVAMLAAVHLMRLGRGSRARFVAITVYSACVIATLGISGAYHSLNFDCRARAIMQHLDYYAIWLLIAGTFTAVHGVMCRGFWRRGLLTLIWSYAAVGAVLQTLWFEIFSGVAGLALYLGLGCVGVASVVRIGRQIGFSAARPIWYAGIAYSAGAVLEAIGHPVLIPDWIGPHEVFHFAVITGATLHWLFIRELLVRHAPATAA
jgi:channel protein (hemolysin III family)